MNIQDDSKQIITTVLENNYLENQIRAMRNNPSMKQMDRFIEEFLSTSLIVLVSDFIHSEDTDFEEDGYFALDKFDNIPLVTFEDETGLVVFPVFSNVSYAENLPYFEGYIPLIMPAMQILEMAHTMDCDKITLNFESAETTDLGKTLIDSIIFKLISTGELSLQSSFV